MARLKWLGNGWQRIRVIHYNKTCEDLFLFINSKQVQKVVSIFESIHSFIPSIGMYRMWWFLAVLRSLFHSSLLYTLSFHPFPPTILPFSLTSSCHLFLGLPLSLALSTFIHNTVVGIIFSNIYIYICILALTNLSRTRWWSLYNKIIPQNQSAFVGL